MQRDNPENDKNEHGTGSKQPVPPAEVVDAASLESRTGTDGLSEGLQPSAAQADVAGDVPDAPSVAGASAVGRVEPGSDLLADSPREDAASNAETAAPFDGDNERIELPLAAQAAAGRTPTPESRQDLLDFLEAWAATVDWHAIDTPEGEAERLTKPRRKAGRSASRNRYSRANAGKAFLRMLEEARHQLDEMERVLEALGRKLDSAKVGEEVEVDADVDTIAKLIYLHNDALESARGVWLRHHLGSRAFDRLMLMSSPAAFGLPLFADEQQAGRANKQWKRIGKRLDQRIVTLDRIIFGMQVAEGIGTLASLAVGGGVVISAARQGGKWAVVKTVARVAASGAAAYGTGKAVEHGLRAAGASEERHILIDGVLRDGMM